MSLFHSLSTTGARLCRALPLATRSYQTATTSVGAPRGVPPARAPITTVQSFLGSIGRSSETKITETNWEAFWKLSGQDLRQAGLAVKDRRYILWCMEKFRQGLPISDFAHAPSPKKTVRGWGPKVQNGVRIRSKRIKDKTKLKRMQAAAAAKSS